jgi:hypothetical protein
MAGRDKPERMTFETWMHAVDVAVEHRAGVSVHDLPDCCFRDWYEDDVPPVTAAKRALEEAGFDA